MRRIVSLVVASCLIVCGTLSMAWARTTLNIWSHWADEENKKAVFYEVANRFQKKYPDVQVNFTWYQKVDLKPALMAAIPGGTGPDVFYNDPPWTEFVTEGLVADIADALNWDNVEEWAREMWEHDGKIYSLQLEAWTVELYYNKDIFEELGIVVPPSYQFHTEEFKELVSKCVAAGYDAFAAGTADRDYPGFFVGETLLLHKLGKEGMDKLYKCELSWKDPRVVEVLNYWKELVDMGAYPEGISGIKLGESHRYFYQEKRAAMFPMGAFYPGRAFVPPEKGGQPKDFRLGIMLYPSWPDGQGNHLVLLSPGGALAVNPLSKNIDLAKKFLAEFAQPDIGALWLNKAVVPTGLKVDPSKITENREYWDMYFSVHKNTENFVGLSNISFKGKMKDTVAQVLNAAFPAGLISVDEAIELLENVRLEFLESSKK